jgi:hypothetical protein
MSSETPFIPQHPAPAHADTVPLPGPTAAPLVLSLGLAMLAAGLVSSLALVIVGGLLLAIGLGLWIAALLPGHGHIHEPLVDPVRRARRVQPLPGTVGHLATGMPGYRLRLPAEVHPISAGLKGGIIGGLVMPVPALTYGLLSGHGLWYPVNLLAGMGLPGVGTMSVPELEQFRPSLVVVATVIHAFNSVVFGLIYGVLLPTLPRIHRALAWGGLLMPILWSGVTYGSLRLVDPLLDRGVAWPWFIVSQFLFGIVTALVYQRLKDVARPLAAGLVGGIVGGFLMPIPAFVWGLATGKGIWYPINLLAAMVLAHGPTATTDAYLRQYHGDWLLAATVIHAAMCTVSGLILGFLVPRLPVIPAPLTWGGLLIPMLWTAVGYGFMGVINPPLQQRVDWPWFIVSQFVFGVVAAVVVLRSELIYIPPAGTGPDRLEEFVAGSGGGPS